MNKNYIEYAVTDITSVIINVVENYTKLYSYTLPKKFYRKIRFKKIKRRYMIKINKLNDLLLSPSFIIKGLNLILNENKENK